MGSPLTTPEFPVDKYATSMPIDYLIRAAQKRAVRKATEAVECCEQYGIDAKTIGRRVAVNRIYDTYTAEELIEYDFEEGGEG